MLSSLHRACQVRDDLKRFLESMMAKSGKLRSLIRELRNSYSKDIAAMQFLFLNSLVIEIVAEFVIITKHLD